MNCPTFYFLWFQVLQDTKTFCILQCAVALVKLTMQKRAVYGFTSFPLLRWAMAFR